jgi:hypothetical protein
VPGIVALKVKQDVVSEVNRELIDEDG